jgi:glycosyltransferase involved in cell wall biosynthesis
MARILIMCATYPADLSSGADLRFQNLIKQLAQRNDCYLVCFGELPQGVEPKSHTGVRDCETLPVFPKVGRSVLRHLRLTNTHFLKRSMPAYLVEMQAAVSKLVRRWEIDALVCMVPSAAEILLQIDVPKLLDYCDSSTLTFRRVLENRGSKMSVSKRLGVYVAYFRQRQRERSLVRQFDRTTTVADADRACLLEVSGVQSDRVVVVPNGVASEALNRKPGAGDRRRSIVFWGNLDFPPNWTAIDYFNREVFLPHLVARNVEWHIIGKGADESIRRLAQHPLIHLHGFVEDLFEEISSHGVMVNPMVEGSGLKNKVLEAFACRLPVVSTTMGIEAVGARPDEHYLVADDPAAFAEAVMRCLEDEDLAATITAAARQFVESHFEWNSIGSKLDALVKKVAG